MKYINSPNEALASSRHLERKQMPGMGDFLPEYKAINQSYKQLGGDATIAYLDVLANTSQKIVMAQQEQYDRMESNKSIQEIDSSFANSEREFLANNPSGKGYTSFVTDTYTQIYKDVASRASNANVANSVINFCENKKAKLTHNAFQAEQSMYRAFVINDTEPRVNELLNTAVKHPEQYDILEDQLALYLSPLKDTMPAMAFEQLSHEKRQDLIYSTGLGLVDKDPHQALALFDKSDFKTLPQDKYLRLQKYADSAIEEEARQARSEELKQKHLNMIMQQQLVDQYKLALAQNMPGIESEINKDSRISEHNKTLLLLQATKKRKEDERVSDVRKILDDALWEGNKDISTNIGDITPKEIDDYYAHVIKTRNDFNRQNGDSPLSLAQKIDIGKQISKIYNGNLKALKVEIANNIKNSQNPNEVLDACISLYENENLPAIAGIDSDIQHFARLAINLYKGSGDERKLLEKRNAWFKVDKDQLEQNKIAWKDSVYNNNSKKNSALKDLYKKAGYKNFWWNTVFGSLEEQTIRGKVEPILKEAFLKSGNQAEAEVIAIDYMHSFVRNSDINGTMEAMINPPTPENTGLSEPTLRKQIRSIKEKIVDYYKKDRKKNLNTSDIKIEAVSADKPIYNFYYIEDGLKFYCVDKQKENEPETRTVYWPKRKGGIQ